MNGSFLHNKIQVIDWSRCTEYIIRNVDTWVLHECLCLFNGGVHKSTSAKYWMLLLLCMYARSECEWMYLRRWNDKDETSEKSLKNIVMNIIHLLFCTWSFVNDVLDVAWKK